MEKVEVSRIWTGLTSMQVCAEDDATDKEILKVCNRDNPSGTSGGWSIVVRSKTDCSKNKIDSTAAPGKCEDYEGRTHFIVMC